MLGDQNGLIRGAAELFITRSRSTKIYVTFLFLIVAVFKSYADAALAIEDKIALEYHQKCAQTGWVPACLEVAGYRCFKHDQFSADKMICRSPSEDGPMFFLTYDKKLEYWNVQVVDGQ